MRCLSCCDHRTDASFLRILRQAKDLFDAEVKMSEWCLVQVIASECEVIYLCTRHSEEFRDVFILRARDLKLFVLFWKWNFISDRTKIFSISVPFSS
jgi:hypothetical protein